MRISRRVQNISLSPTLALDARAKALAARGRDIINMAVGEPDFDVPAVVADAACDTLCEQQLYLARQLRESLGREKDRMDRVWLVSDAAAVPERLNKGLHGATVLRVPADQLAKWLAPAQGHSLAEHLYVIDPMGNWMMRFPARMDVAGASRAKRDLDRLLRASASWDEPGR